MFRNKKSNLNCYSNISFDNPFLYQYKCIHLDAMVYHLSCNGLYIYTLNISVSPTKSLETFFRFCFKLKLKESEQILNSQMEYGT